MKTMFANLNAIVGDTLADSIQMIDIDELHESKDNFFAIDRIEEFAETILGQGGVKDNLVVRPLESDGYEIISGHRRKAAVQYLLDNGENISRYLPCLVQDYSDDDTRMLDLILMNISSRQISDTELWQSYETLKRILQSKKESGEKFGRVRDKLAELLGVSSAQIGKMENVSHNAIEPVIDAVQKGEVSIFTANEIAKLDVDAQEALVQQGDLKNIKHKDVKKKNEELKKCATNSTNSELDAEPENEFQNDELEKCATNSTNSESDAELENEFQNDEPEKCATNSTNSESDAEPKNEFQNDELEKCATNSTNSESDAEPENDFQNDEPEKCATNSTNSESDAEPENDFQNDEPEKRATNSTNSEPDENSEKSVTDTLSHFIHEHYFELETVFTAYTSITDSDDEIQMIEEFQELLRKVKEAEREKIRFGFPEQK